MITEEGRWRVPEKDAGDYRRGTLASTGEGGW